jgi:hypothetical protein
MPNTPGNFTVAIWLETRVFADEDRKISRLAEACCDEKTASGDECHWCARLLQSTAPACAVSAPLTLRLLWRLWSARRSSKQVSEPCSRSRGRELAVVAATPTTAPPDRLIAWMRRIEVLQRGRYVPDVARFSTPPRLEDLDALTLDDTDFEDIRNCRPGDCGLKLSSAEIRRLRHLDRHPGWERAVEDEFRRALLERARCYLAEGDFGLPLHEDDSTAVAAAIRFATLMDHLGLISPRLPGKDGAVAVTAIVGSPARSYLVYSFRSDVDVLAGVFGGLVRRVIERRVQEEAPTVLSGLRVRLESGDPEYESKHPDRTSVTD